MLPFLHDRLQRLETLLARCSAVLQTYNRFDLDLAPALTTLLDEATTTYRALNRSSTENRLLALKAEFLTAERGMNPLTLERPATHRREMARAIALRVLQQCSEQMRSDCDDDRRQLADATQQLRPLLLLALQKGLLALPAKAVKTRAPTRAVSQKTVQALWRSVLATPDMGLAARQLALQLSATDIELLLIGLIATLP